MLRVITFSFIIVTACGYDIHVDTSGNESTDTKSYNLEVPGKEPITIIETNPTQTKWLSPPSDPHNLSNVDTEDRERCYGPSCRDYEFNEDAQDQIAEIITNYDKLFGKPPSKDQIAAIGELASSIKQSKYKSNKYANSDSDSEDKSSVATSWNRLKVKQHKHPYDDKDGWVTMEAVPWTTSKISKWKPNKKKPNHWDDDESQDDNKFSDSQANYFQRPYNNKKRPSYINNQPHYTEEWANETPKPWNSGASSYSSSWTEDDSRKPTKPCDEKQSSNPAVYYGLSDSVITDSKPTYFPYEALKRPTHRPTQVVYAGFPDDRVSSHPFEGDGQWILLSTTKGYHPNKKRQRSMSIDSKNSNTDVFAFDEPSTIVAHKSIALTVLPTDEKMTNMTTSHGGLLEVERSFQTVEESKKESDDRKVYSDIEPIMSGTKNKFIKTNVFSNRPDSSTVLAAVGAGMLPATMAMVVPMMLGKKRRRRDVVHSTPIEHLLYRYNWSS